MKKYKRVKCSKCGQSWIEEFECPPKVIENGKDGKTKKNRWPPILPR